MNSFTIRSDSYIPDLPKSVSRKGKRHFQISDSGKERRQRKNWATKKGKEGK